jgi:drug/metabolite transporter (DMT)-like permease
MPNPHLKAYLALLVGLAAISFGAIFARWAALPGVVAGFYRQFIMFIALTPFFALRLRRARHTGPAMGPTMTRRAVWLSLLAGLFFAADLAFWLTSLNHTSAANSVLLANTAPLYVGLGAMLLFNERLGTAFWLGLAVALSGSALIVRHDLRISSSVGIGALLGLAAGLTYGLYLLTISRARRGIDALSSAWVTSISGGLVLLALNVGLRQSLAGFAPRQWLALAAMGLISQTIGWVTLNYVLGKLPAGIVSVTLLAQPVATSLLSIPLLSEDLSQTQVIGGLVVLSGIAIVNLNRSSPHKRDPEPAPATTL